MAERIFGQKKSMIIKEVSVILQQSTAIASIVVHQLIQEGYLVLNKVKYGSSFQYELTETVKGRRFGIATADPPITRQKADVLLKELIARAEVVNSDPALLYLVETIKVFGSFLSGKPVLSDLDVAVKLTRKAEGDEFMKKNKERIRLAFENGRRFSNYTEEIYWPYREVMLMLKTKKKGLSLHDEENDEILKKTGSKLVYAFKPDK